MNWIQLTDLGQLNELVVTSMDKTMLVFKHSTRCSISRMALRQFEKEFDIAEDKIDTYFLDLLNYRAISNEITIRFDTEHQSPQLLLIQNGKVIYTVSHSDISAEELKKQVH